MLLRIDVYPSDYAVDEASAAGRLEPQQTLYACLACATPTDDSKDHGRLLTIGRKTGDLLLSTDKSVSREHCILRLISANKTHQKVHHSADSSAAAAAVPMAPQNPEQTAACQESDNHMCVVLENVGKLGSYLVQEDATQADKKKKAENDDSSATGDDATDDEGDHAAAGHAAAGAGLSPFTKKLVDDPSKATLKMIGPKKSTILTELSKEEHGRAIVQCGKLGSTVIITRQVIRFVRSGMTKKDLAGLHSKFWTAGIVESNTLADEITHVVTRTRNPTPKQLAAWCMGIPIVSADYLTALLDRTSPADPLPDPASYAPAPDSNDFWEHKANRRLWSSCTYLSIKQQDDLEVLIRAAGCSVVQLHGMKEPAAMEKAAAVMADTQHCFGITDSRRRLTRLLRQAGLVQISPQTLARCMTEQRLLEDGQGNPIGVPVVDFVETELAAKEAAAATPAAEKDDGKSKEKIVEKGPSKKLKEPAEEKESSSQAAAEAKETEELKKKRAKQSPQEPDAAEKSKAKEAEPTAGDAAPELAAAGDGDEPKQAPAVEEKAVEPIKKKRASDAENKEPSKDDQPLKRMKLTTKKDGGGWLTAAPKGKQRRAFQRSMDEIREATGNEEVIEVAPTKTCKGLIVGNNDSAPKPAAHSSRKKTTGPDFKRFRKNTVARISTAQRRIKYRLVLPKESEEQREFDDQRHELEEQQRRADELFRDPVRTTSRRRRR